MCEFNWMNLATQPVSVQNRKVRLFGNESRGIIFNQLIKMWFTHLDDLYQFGFTYDCLDLAYISCDDFLWC